MNPEQVKQIVETIKTLNINFNDATTQKIAEAIIPVVKWYFILTVFKTIVVASVILIAIFLIYKLIKRELDRENE